MPEQATDDMIEETRLSTTFDEAILSPKSGATEVYLVRHGDALPGADEISSVDYDAQALSELGRRQAEALAQRMARTHLQAIYSSPTGRAYETACTTAAVAGLPVHVVAGLREVALGNIAADTRTGASRDEIANGLKRKLAQVAILALATGNWNNFPEAEPSTHLRERLVSTIDTLAAVHPGSRIAVFSHGGAVNAYIAAVLGIERDYFFPAANTSVSIVRVRGSAHLVMALNDVCHLHQSGLLKLPE